MPYIEHRYGNTYYESRGRKSAKGMPLVCLHGGPGGHSHRMKDLFKLSDDRQVFIYDQIGGGRSSATTPSQWKISTFVNELKILVDAWGLEQFHLFGASWGTTLALEYYLNRKNNRVQSIIFQSPLFSTAHWQADAEKLIKGLPAKERKVIRYCHEIGATDSQVYRDAMTAYYAEHVCRKKNLAKSRSEFKNPNGNKVYAHMWGASEFHATGTLSDYDRSRDLSKVNCPTLFICGQYDEARPQTARKYVKQIPDSRLSVIDNASHAILSEKPGALIRTIRGFIRAQDS
jgi:proline iminopeptidase